MRAGTGGLRGNETFASGQRWLDFAQGVKFSACYARFVRTLVRLHEPACEFRTFEGSLCFINGIATPAGITTFFDRLNGIKLSLVLVVQ
jgi:hypothetical protein